jgi:hypothetical protein
VYPLDSLPASYGTRRFTVAFIRTLQTKPTQSTSPHPISPRCILLLLTRHKYTCTWTSPDGKPHYHIDILIERRRHSIVLYVRSFRAADCDTGHTPVVAKVKERLAMNKQISHRFHVEQVQSQEVKRDRGKEKNSVV